MLDELIHNRSVGDALLEAPIGELVERLSVAIVEAQLRLDKTSRELAIQLGNSTVQLKDAQGQPITRSLLELGFTPSFYHFSEAVIEVKMNVSLRVEERVGAGLDLSIGDVSPRRPKTEEPGAKGAEGPAGKQAEGTTGKQAEGTTGKQAEGTTGKQAEGPTGKQAEGPTGKQAEGTGTPGKTPDKSEAQPQKQAVPFGMAISLEYSRKYNFDQSGNSTLRTTLVSVPAPAAFLDAVKTATRSGGSGS